MTVIQKTPEDLCIPPNFGDYEHTPAAFDWSEVPDLCAGLGSGACNIAYAAVDRHAEGPASTRTALSPLFSAFGPAPLATRVNIGQAAVLVWYTAPTAIHG